MYLIYDKETSIVDRALYGSSEPIDANIGPDEAFIAVRDPVIARLPDYSYIHNGEWVHAAPAPSPHHEWDWPTKSWLPNLDAAREAKRQQVVAELGIQLYLPCNGFDADKISRERISGMIARLQRGDGLPTGWVGWRDASNQQQWASDNATAVLAKLISLSRAIEEREQGLLIRGWQHKAAIAVLEDVTSILNYDTSSGW